MNFSELTVLDLFGAALVSVLVVFAAKRRKY